MLQDKINLYCRRERVGDSIKWTELYDCVEDLIDDMLETSYYVRGYEYINSFKDKINSGKELNSKEITQLKRLAKFIFADVNRL